MADDASDVEIVGSRGDSAMRDAPVSDDPARVVAGVLGLTAFVTAALVGLAIGNPGSVILTRALLAMIVCALVGRALGAAGKRCVREYLDSFKSDHPIPEMPGALSDLYADDGGRDGPGGAPDRTDGKNS